MKNTPYTPGMLIGVGLAIGAGLGVAMDNLAIGIAIGVVLGIAADFWFRSQAGKDNDPPTES